MNNYYVTTPIFYVNSTPHIGHAYTAIIADSAARLNRLLGKEVKLLTGTDEHGQKIQQAANAANQNCIEFTDQISKMFQELMLSCNISNDDFIRTTEQRHKIAVDHVWKVLQDRGDIYLGKYSGWYCIRDEAFFQKSELTEDLLSPSGAPVEWIEEDSYFFALSKWQEPLLEFYQENPNFILPISRKNEVVNFVKSGLKDLSISRTSCTWGIPVPHDSKHTVYVWLDALVNYISALGYPNENSVNFKKFWPANAHVIGKDILRFHAIYWPAFLMALNLPIPKHLIVHGWWMKDGQKMSKSLGNVVEPIKLNAAFGTDAVRYFLLREKAIGNDGSISKEAFIKRVNHELADKIGNLVQRTLTFTHKNFAGKVPKIELEKVDIISHPLLIQSKIVLNSLKNSVIEMQFHEALKCIIDLANAANKHLEETAPWNLLKTNKANAAFSIYVALEIIRHIGIYLQPFIPESASKILNQLTVPLNKRTLHHAAAEFAIESDTKVQSLEIIFKKVDAELTEF
jgi:methionyl-tRNA synthetase